jgi:4-amino-4-deoxy-L-arabinose transferase-like glycosyltransferase
VVLLLVIVAAGAFFRFHMLGIRSLWPAECFSILVARQPWPAFLRTMWWGEANMAVYYFLLRGWLLLGDSEMWLQGLSAFLGVATIAVVYALGNRFLAWRVGFVAAALLAIHSFHIGHSQELRSYSLLTLLVVLSTYCFLALLDSPNKKSLWVLYLLFSALALYAQMFAVFVILSHWLALTPYRIKRLGLVKWILANTAIGILSLPLVAVTVLQNHGQLDWVPPLSPVGTLNVFRAIVGADTLALKSPEMSALLLILYVVVWFFAIWGLLLKERSGIDASMSATAVSVLVWSCAFPILAMTVISFMKPILYPRYLLMSVPAAVILAAQGFAAIEQFVAHGRVASFVLLLLMIALSLASTHQFDARLATSGFDYRGVTKYILSRRQGSDAIIFYKFSGNWAWEYYVGRARKTGDAEPVPTVLSPLTFDRAEIENRMAAYPRVWLVLHQDIPTPQSDVNTALLVRTIREHFGLTEEVEFPGQSMFPGEDASIRLALYAAAVPANSR